MTHTDVSAAAAIRVIFFASLRETVGCAEKRIPVATLPTAELTGLLTHLHTVLAPEAADAIGAANVRIAVNQELVSGNVALNPGDEVAFLPPVTGG